MINYDWENGLGADPVYAKDNYFVRLMLPQEFLGLNQKRKAPFRFIQKHILNGGSISNPMLVVEWLTIQQLWQVVDHEGRGRSSAIDMIDPMHRIPVHIFPNVVTSTNMERSAFKADRRKNANLF